MNRALSRVLCSFLVHLVILLIAGALIFLLGSGESAVSATVRGQYSDQPATIDLIRGDGVWQLLRWTALSLLASGVLAGLWLILAERKRPSGPREGASMRGSWTLLLLLTLLAVVVIGWQSVWAQSVQADLAEWMVTTGLLIVGFATLLAYWLGTGTSVKTVMRPSVPLGRALPQLGRSAE